MKKVFISRFKSSDRQFWTLTMWATDYDKEIDDDLEWNYCIEGENGNKYVGNIIGQYNTPPSPMSVLFDWMSKVNMAALNGASTNWDNNK